MLGLLDTRCFDSASAIADAAAREVLDAIGAGCQMIGPDYRYLYVHDVAVTQEGLAREEMLARTACWRSTPSNRDAFDDAEVILLDELALDLGHGLTSLRAKAEREWTQELSRRAFLGRSVGALLIRLPGCRPRGLGTMTPEEAAAILAAAHESLESGLVDVVVWSARRDGYEVLAITEQYDCARVIALIDIAEEPT